MNEKSQFRDVLIKFVIVFLFGCAYSLGGAEFGPGKWVRRFLAPFILVGGCFWFSRDWRSLVSFPLLCIGLSLGYGADDTWLKVIKRLYCGLVLGIGSAAGDLLNKRWLLSGFQIAFICATMVILGVWNVFPNARAEEFTIGACIALFPVMSARKRE